MTTGRQRWHAAAIENIINDKERRVAAVISTTADTTVCHPLSAVHHFNSILAFVFVACFLLASSLPPLSNTIVHHHHLQTPLSISTVECHCLDLIVVSLLPPPPCHCPIPLPLKYTTTIKCPRLLLSLKSRFVFHCHHQTLLPAIKSCHLLSVPCHSPSPRPSNAHQLATVGNCRIH